MRDTRFLNEKNEFMFLYRFKLMEYFSIYTEYHPDPRHMNAECYDTEQQIQDKLATVINVKSPSLINYKDFVINITIPEAKLETIHDLENYIVELNKRKSGFIMRSMTHKENMVEVENLLAAQVFDIMYRHGLASLQEEAEQAVQQLVKTAGYSQVEAQNFYRDLKNNPNANQIFLTILEQACMEFKTQIFDTETARLMLNHDCGCWNKDLDKPKEKYVRKSFALKVAYEALDYEPMRSLWVYRCDKTPADKTIWHITKSIQIR